MPTHSEIRAELRLADEQAGYRIAADFPAQYAKAVETLAGYRALVAREKAEHGFSSIQNGIAHSHRDAAAAALDRLEKHLATLDTNAQVAAVCSALNKLSVSDGDLFTQASRRQMHGKLVERYAALTMPDAERVRASSPRAA